MTDIQWTLTVISVYYTHLFIYKLHMSEILYAECTVFKGTIFRVLHLQQFEHDLFNACLFTHHLFQAAKLITDLCKKYSSLFHGGSVTHKG